MTTYKNCIETIITELEDIKQTIPTNRYNYALESAIKALSAILED